MRPWSRSGIGISCALILVLAPVTAVASVFNRSPGTSELSIKIGRAPTFRTHYWGLPMYVGPPSGTVSLAASIPSIEMEESVFSTYGSRVQFGTSLFSLVPPLHALRFDLRNGEIEFAAATASLPQALGAGSYQAGEVTGQAPMAATFYAIHSSWNFDHWDTHAVFTYGLNRAGSGGSTGEPTPTTFRPGWVLSFDRWGTAAHSITGITSRVIQLPNRSPPVSGVALTLEPESTEVTKIQTTLGGFATSNPNGLLSVRNTVTLTGSWDLTSGTGGTGSVTLVTPLRIVTNGPAGNLPGFVRMRLDFVPEPSAALSLLVGAVALALLGARRG